MRIHPAQSPEREASLAAVFGGLTVRRRHRSDFFPSAHQVVTKDIVTLRTAGLSGRKAEYGELPAKGRRALCSC